MRRVLLLSLSLVTVLPALGFAGGIAFLTWTAPEIPRPECPTSLDPYRAAQSAAREGDTLRCLAHLLAVEKDDPNYVEAQRWAGEEIVLSQLGQPHAALPYVQRALLAEPGKAASWTAVARVYGRILD